MPASHATPTRSPAPNRTTPGPVAAYLPHDLMAGGDVRSLRRKIAFGEVQVGTADAAAHDPDQQLTSGPGLRNRADRSAAAARWLPGRAHAPPMPACRPGYAELLPAPQARPPRAGRRCSLSSRCCRDIRRALRLGQFARTILVDLRNRDLERHRQAVRAAPDRAERHMSAHGGVAGVHLLASRHGPERALETGRVACGEQLLGIRTTARAAHGLGHPQIDLEAARRWSARARRARR